MELGTPLPTMIWMELGIGDSDMTEWGVGREIWMKTRIADMDWGLGIWHIFLKYGIGTNRGIGLERDGTIDTYNIYFETHNHC